MKLIETVWERFAFPMTAMSGDHGDYGDLWLVW
jgi:hypothetical protein